MCYETCTSFQWLFKTFLEYIGRRQPETVETLLWPYKQKVWFMLMRRNLLVEDFNVFWKRLKELIR